MRGAAVRLGGTGFEEPRTLDRVCAHEMVDAEARELASGTDCDPVLYRSCSRGAAELGFRSYYEPLSNETRQTLAEFRAGLSSSRVFLTEHSAEQARTVAQRGITYRLWDSLSGNRLQADGQPQGLTAAAARLDVEQLLEGAAAAPLYEGLRNVYRELIGFFTPAQSGLHRFKVTSGYAQSMLWLGETEAEAVMVAEVTTVGVSARNRQGDRDWNIGNTYGTQDLIAGQRYFIRAVSNTGSESHGAPVGIGVVEPDMTELLPIPVSIGEHVYLHDRGARASLRQRTTPARLELSFKFFLSLAEY
jgi:hypothetical protein